jgi:sec-independent protein translocase protein TatA
MFGLGLTEIIIIAIVLGLLFFGSNKVTELAKSAGRFSGEFKKSKTEIENELKNVKKEFKDSEEKAIEK